MVQQIDINGKPVRMIFGMHFAENFSNDISKNLREDGTMNLSSSRFSATIIWFGYLNWCEVKDEAPTVERSDVYEWVEMTYSEDDEEKIGQLVKVMEAYQRSAFGKGIKKKAEEFDEAKKKLNGAVLEVSPSEF